MLLALLLLVFLSPRAILVLEWLFNNARFNLVFSSFWWVLLGFIFLPWTTLAFFFVYNPALGYLIGWDWFWIVLGVVADLASYGSTRYKRSYS